MKRNVQWLTAAMFVASRIRGPVQVSILIVTLLGSGWLFEPQARTVNITVTQGASWEHSFNIMWLIKVTNQPQMSFWLEDSSGNFVATMYVTHRIAHQEWRASPGEKKEEIRRPSALPVWSHLTAGAQQAKSNEPGARLHAGDGESIDAVSGATPKTGFVKQWVVPSYLPDGLYTIKAEINHSKDFNDHYKESDRPNAESFSGGKMGSGQPSLVWSATVRVGDRPTTTHLKMIGHGHPAGNDGAVYADLGAIDSALDIVKQITATYLPD